MQDEGWPEIEAWGAGAEGRDPSGPRPQGYATGEVAADLPWPPVPPPPWGTADQLAQAQEEAKAEHAAWQEQQLRQQEAALARATHLDPHRHFWASTWLCFASFLFAFRVLGQLIVLGFAPWWLPPMEEWYSGLLPYPLLLPCQLAILAWMAHANAKTLKGEASWWRPKPTWAWGLGAFAAIYAGGMLARYVISAHLHPERGLLPPGSLPILFHFVLASYLAALAWVFSRRDPAPW